MNTALLWAKIIGFVNKIWPWLAVFIAFLKGKAAERERLEKANLEKQLEYVQIAADKPSTVDDDVSRMREGTF